MSTTTLSDIISNITTDANDNFWPKSEAWVRFVKDHRDYLLKNCYEHTAEKNDLRKFKYSIDGYCKSAGVPVSIGWVILWLNQLDSNFKFDENVETLLIPTSNAMTFLLKQFTTVVSMQTTKLGFTNI